MSQETY